VAEIDSESDQPSGKKRGDLALLLALAQGLSVPKAAAKAGLSERTAYRRLQDPDFKARVTRARAEMVERALGQLSAGTAEAAFVLRKLLRGADDRVKLGAAKAILDSQLKLRNEIDLAERVATLEELLKAKRGKS